MTDDAPPEMIAVVAVYLRGRAAPVLVRYATKEMAYATVEFVARTYLKNCPQDRAGVWCSDAGGTSVVVTEHGVGEVVKRRLTAAIDPREIQAVEAGEVARRPEWEAP